MSDRVDGIRFAGLDTPVKLGAWLRARIKEYGLSVSDVAVDIGTAPGTVYNWLKGKLPPPPRDGGPDRFEEGLLAHPGLALSSRQREQLAEQRRVLVGAATGAPPVEAPAWQSRALPASVATFTGRYAQLDQLNRLLVRRERGGAVVISALSGTGGVGKTALAVHWAHTPEVRRTFPDGALYVNLNGFSETEPVPPHEAQAQLLRQSGVKPRAIPLEPDAVDGLYHETLTGRGLLLVLDNARDEPQVRPLLPKEPRCLAIVTSRNRLAGLTVTHDAAGLNLDALTPRESARLLRRLLGGAADRDPDAVDALAETCAHLPLALRIAAADHLAGPRRTGLGEYVAGLAEDRLAKLAVGSSDPATAMAAVLDRSYRNLSPDARRALRLLACHPGADWDRYAAAALLGTGLGPVDALIGELRDHSLLDFVDAPTGQRNRMHDLTAEYARTHPDTEAHHAEQSLRRWWNHCHGAARAAMDRFAPQDANRRQAPPPLPGPVPELSELEQATAWLDAERSNLLTAVRGSAEAGESRTVLALVETIFRYLEVQGYWRDGVMVCTLECEHTAPEDRCRALNRLAVVRGRSGPPGAGRELFEQALDLARKAGDFDTETSVLNNLGVMSTKLGRFDEAIDHYRQSMDAARAGRDEVRLARALVNVSVIHIRRGDHDLAGENCRQALDLARAHGIHSIEVFTLNNLGTVYEAQGDLVAAAEHFRQGLTLARRFGARVAERACLTGLGSVSELNGKVEDALPFYREALALTERVEDRSGRVSVLNDLSVTLRRLDRLDESIEHAREALTLAAELDDMLEQARAHDAIAAVLAARDDPAGARRHWTEALRIHTELGTPDAEDVERRLAETPSP